jgi:hypothetical protein
MSADAETEATITVTPIGLPLSPLLADLPLEPDHEDPNTQKLLDLAQSAGERGLTRAEIKVSGAMIDSRKADGCSARFAGA